LQKKVNPKRIPAGLYGMLGVLYAKQTVDS